MAVPQSSYINLIYFIGMNHFSSRYIFIVVFFKTQGRPPKNDFDILLPKLSGIKNEKIRCSLCEYPFSRMNLVGIIVYLFIE